ncbi:MAG: TIM barrel protein [Candidatus Thorarchaeota archaeon]
MLGISIRANWDFENILNAISDLNLDMCEIQLDNPIFKFQKYRKKILELINNLCSLDLRLSFHLTFIDVNIASLDNKIRYYTSRLLRKEIDFVSNWEPVYVVMHTGKISDTFYQMPSIKEKAHKQQVKTISEVIKLCDVNSIPLAIENRQRSTTKGLIENVKDIQYYSQKFPSLHFLLDIGHLNTFYSDSSALLEEIYRFCDFQIIALHLSNNFGNDTHGNLEEGTIPIKLLFSEIPDLKKKILIIENKSFKNSLKSLDFIRQSVLRNS